MGSDHPPQVLFEAVLQAANKLDPSTSLMVIVQEEFFAPLYEKTVVAGLYPRIQFIPVSQHVTMQDDPLLSLKRKKNASMFKGISLLKKKVIDVFVSAGNTGALIASSRLTLPPLPGIHRPALLALLPTQTGRVAVLDVGGNVASKTTFLVQFANMGAAFIRAINPLVSSPRVGLLNIGVESKKGSESLQHAYSILKEEKISFEFLGNIEGREVFDGKVDVLVTDGFTGNVLLKTAEGLASFLLKYLKEHPSFNESSLSSLKQQFNYAEYPGAIVMGVDGLVIKCHGNTSISSMLLSILSAENYFKLNVINKVKKELFIN